jgi:hypothetical protein
LFELGGELTPSAGGVVVAQVVVRAEVLVRGVGGYHVPGRDQDAVADGEFGAVAAPAGGQPSVAGTEVSAGAGAGGRGVAERAM